MGGCQSSNHTIHFLDDDADFADFADSSSTNDDSEGLSRFQWLRSEVCEASYDLVGGRMAQELGDCLLRNTWLTKLSIGVADLHFRENYDSLLKYIAESSSLKEIDLRGKERSVLDDPWPLEVMDEFVNAIIRNESIEKLSVRSCRLHDQTLFNLLMRARKIKSFWLESVSSGISQQSFERMRQFSNSQTTLENLKLELLDDCVIIFVLSAFTSSSTLRKATLVPHYTCTELTSQAIYKFLNGNHSLETIEFKVGNDWNPITHSGKDTIQLLVEALQDYHALKSLTLSLADSVKINEIESIFEHNKSITTFSFNKLPSVSKILRQKNCSIKAIVIQEGPIQCFNFEFLALLEGRHTLESLSLPNSLHTDDWRFVAFVDCIPRMQGIKKLQIDFCGDAAEKQRVLDAFEKNGQLEEVCLGNSTKFFNNNDLALIDSFCHRNKSMRQLLESGNINESFIPLTMEFGLRGQGPGMVFRSLTNSILVET